MNFLEGRLVRSDGLHFKGEDGILLPVPAERADRYGQLTDQPVTLGIRPEHCAATSPATLPLKGVAVEPLGPHTLLVGHVGQPPFTAQVSAGITADAAETVPVGIQTEQMHLFDQATGLVV
jgi:multiple sugar transport system ATP-binding protein